MMVMNLWPRGGHRSIRERFHELVTDIRQPCSKKEGALGYRSVRSGNLAEEMIVADDFFDMINMNNPIEASAA